MKLTEQDRRLGSPLLIALALVLWGVGLSYGSGWGQAHQIYEKTMYATVSCGFLYVLLTGKIRYVELKTLLVLLFLVFQNIYTYMEHGTTYAEYIWLYLIVYLIAQFRLTQKQLTLIGIVYGILGGAVLYVANYTSVLSGWDGNSISMIAFFSYTVFAAGFSNLRKFGKLIIFFAYSLAYFYLLDSLDSRSSILFSVFLLLGIWGIIPLKKMLHSRGATNIMFLFPLVVALFVVLIRNESFVAELNAWSYETFQKPIFNGRDGIWYSGFQSWKENWLLGTGNFGGNWHNSAVTCLVGAGATGYIVWLNSLNSCCKIGRKWLADPGVFGLLSAFMVIWLQQSVELGLIQTRGNPIPFVALGLLFARIHTLEEFE